MDTEEGDLSAYDYLTLPRQFVSYRWFKPILVGALTFVVMLALQMGVFGAATIWSGDVDFISTSGNGYDDMNPYTGPGALAEIGGIAVVLPALALAVLTVRDRPFSSYSSSRGGWSWSAFARCLCIALIVMGIMMVIEALLSFDDDAIGEIKFTAAGLVLCFLLVPLQCVAEEYLFRGLLMQTIGAWTRLPALAILTQAALFAAGHPYNALGVAAIFLDGVIWGAITWRTSGLEATCALHVANNMLAFGLDGFGLGTSGSQVSVVTFAMSLAIDVMYAAAILLIVRRLDWFRPSGDATHAFNEQRKAELSCREGGGPPPPSQMLHPSQLQSDILAVEHTERVKKPEKASRQTRA